MNCIWIRAHSAFAIAAIDCLHLQNNWEQLCPTGAPFVQIFIDDPRAAQEIGEAGDVAHMRIFPTGSGTEEGEQVKKMIQSALAMDQSSKVSRSFVIVRRSLVRG